MYLPSLCIYFNFFSPVERKVFCFFSAWICCECICIFSFSSNSFMIYANKRKKKFPRFLQLRKKSKKSPFFCLVVVLFYFIISNSFRSLFFSRFGWHTHKTKQNMKKALNGSFFFSHCVFRDEMGEREPDLRTVCIKFFFPTVFLPLLMMLQSVQIS